MRIKCEDVQATLDAFADRSEAPEYRRAAAHVEQCPSCRYAAGAVAALRAERAMPVPPISGDARVRAARAAADRAAAAGPAVPGRVDRRSFWLGGLAGAGLAAGIAVAVVLVRPVGPPAAATPVVTAAVDQVRQVSIAVDSPVMLAGAELRLELTGDIELDGYAGVRELSWQTDLDAGTNQLRLPIVVRGAEGGQLRLVVRTGQRSRSFLVDVRAGTESSPGRV